MNQARIACPQLTSTGQCLTRNCQYNHSRVGPSSSLSGTADANAAAVAGMTGWSGQYVGSRKGGNAVPVSQSGELPKFLQGRLPVRSGGNDREVRLVSAMAAIPAAPAKRTDAPVIDWKAVALSKAAAKSESSGRKAELTEELAKLSSLCGERQAALSRLEQEIQSLRYRLPQASEPLRQKYQAVSVKAAEMHDRAVGTAAIVAEEKERCRSFLAAMEETNLVDVSEVRSNQDRILAEVERLFEAYRKNYEFIGTEFRAAAATRLRRP